MRVQMHNFEIKVRGSEHGDIVAYQFDLGKLFKFWGLENEDKAREKNGANNDIFKPTWPEEYACARVCVCVCRQWFRYELRQNKNYSKTISAIFCRQTLSGSIQSRARPLKAPRISFFTACRYESHFYRFKCYNNETRVHQTMIKMILNDSFQTFFLCLSRRSSLFAARLITPMPSVIWRWWPLYHTGCIRVCKKK